MCYMCYSWCGDGSLLATGSRDGLCKIWFITDTASTANAAQGNKLMYLLTSLDLSCCLHLFFYLHYYLLLSLYLNFCLNLRLRQIHYITPPTMFVFSLSVGRKKNHRLYCTDLSYIIVIQVLFCFMIKDNSSVLTYCTSTQRVLLSLLLLLSLTLFV
jgi:WD40 repeat protein